MTRKISEGRKTAFYIGTGLQVVGGLLFLSVFVTHFANFGDFSNFEAKAQSFGLRALGGMVLLILGGFMKNVGARGLAGSSVILDPARAKEEIEPFSRMAGGMTKDFLDEADINLSNLGGKSEMVVMIKCQACKTLNEDDSKFCQECGEEI